MGCSICLGTSLNASTRNFFQRGGSHGEGKREKSRRFSAPRAPLAKKGKTPSPAAEMPLLKRTVPIQPSPVRKKRNIEAPS